MIIKVHEKHICEYRVDDDYIVDVIDALESIRMGDWRPDGRERKGIDEGWKVLVEFGDGGWELWSYRWDRKERKFGWVNVPNAKSG